MSKLRVWWMPKNRERNVLCSGRNSRGRKESNGHTGNV